MGLKNRVDRLEEKALDDELFDLPRLIIKDRGKYYANHVHGNKPLTPEEVEAIEAKDKFGQILWIHIHDPRTTAVCNEPHGS